MFFTIYTLQFTSIAHWRSQDGWPSSNRHEIRLHQFQILPVMSIENNLEWIDVHSLIEKYHPPT